MTYCTKCGAENQQGSTFCHNCGSRLIEANINQTQEDPLPQSVKSSQPLVPTGPVGATGLYQQSGSKKSPPPRRKASSGSKITFIVTLVIAAILIWMSYSPGLIDFNINPNNDSSSHSTQLNSGNYNVSYSWVYPYSSNTEWTINVKIPVTTYSNYSDQPKTYNYASYVTKDDPIVGEIAKELKNDAKNNSFDTAQFVLSFVQNVPYGTDANPTGQVNFPRYPDETLVDGIGDCTDHSTLYVSLMESPAINVAMVLLKLTRPGSPLDIWPQEYWQRGIPGHTFRMMEVITSIARPHRRAG